VVDPAVADSFECLAFHPDGVLLGEEAEREEGEKGRKEGERGVRPLIFSISAFFALRDRHKCRQGPHVGRKDTGEEKDGRKKG
jgi:hypothetical protein